MNRNISLVYLLVLALVVVTVSGCAGRLTAPSSNGAIKNLDMKFMSRTVIRVSFDVVGSPTNSEWYYAVFGLEVPNAYNQKKTQFAPTHVTSLKQPGRVEFDYNLDQPGGPGSCPPQEGTYKGTVQLLHDGPYNSYLIDEAKLSMPAKKFPGACDGG